MIRRRDRKDTDVFRCAGCGTSREDTRYHTCAFPGLISEFIYCLNCLGRMGSQIQAALKGKYSPGPDDEPHAKPPNFGEDALEADV